MLPLLPIFLAVAIGTYDICKIAQRAGSKKSDENSKSDANSNCVDDENNKDSEDNENINITNSADAIRFIKSQQKSNGQVKRDRWGGGRYGK